jgi:hypothetical protein
MGRRTRACALFLLVLAPLAASLVLVGGASAAGVRCEEMVLADWSDNGRVDGVYPLRCYQQALAIMPTDLRDYTNASDAIHRALTRAVTATGSRGLGTEVAVGSTTQVGADETRALPLPLVLLVGVSVAVLAAGTLDHLARRRRTSRD